MEASYTINVLRDTTYFSGFSWLIARQRIIVTFIGRPDFSYFRLLDSVNIDTIQQ